MRIRVTSRRRFIPLFDSLSSRQGKHYWVNHLHGEVACPYVTLRRRTDGLLHGEHAGRGAVHSVSGRLVVLIRENASPAAHDQTATVASHSRVAEVYERVRAKRPDAVPAVEGRCGAVDDDASPRGVGVGENAVDGAAGHGAI